MTKFKFKFEAVNKVKQNLEKKVTRDLALINLEINSISNEIENLFAEKQKVRSGSFTGSRIKANELQTRLNYEKFLDEIIKIKLERKASMEIEKGKIIEELAQKKKEVKIFDSLKEKHLQLHNLEQNKNELFLLDEIAAKKFSKA